ncbi:TolC family outer membrane protein [Curvibacter sp. CHRR-16]|uniref:TolC family outer membrane protein n=1 Tax=Curvibacter sp. CHRR-16 TaxID=2835872 RepID=UPI001BDA85D2|nr:TolC family outer membrane protein [Curvibacter sp. CHRR-16]MBT0570979.1 TolC family outer membrane protein [Curvibacter sp. CHRR-16]
MSTQSTPSVRQRTNRLTMLAIASALTCLATSASAHSLGDLLQAARQYDATYLGAQQQYQANLAKAEQSKSLLLPTVGLSASSTRTSTQSDPGVNEYAYNTNSATVSASQPLYNPSNKASYDQAKIQLISSQAQLNAAEQDLIVRVAQAYFDALASQDSLSYVQAQKKAVAEQLASAKRNFEVGTATITDSKEAQSRYDLVVAQELAAQNDLEIKTLALRQLVGIADAQPDPISNTLPTAEGDMQAWIDKAMQQHPTLQQLQIAEQVAKLETEKARAGHKPTVSLTGSYTMADAVDGTSSKSFGGTTVHNKNASIGVSVSIPLYSGGSTQNRIKETLALEDKAHDDVLAAQRSISQNVRSAYLGLTSGLSQVKAEASSQSSLESNQVGYRVGVRINIDVLNAQSQLYSTKSSLAQARYNVLMTSLKLKQAVGVLTTEDALKLSPKP